MTRIRAASLIGKPYNKAGPGSRLTVNGDPAAHGLDELADDEEPEAQPAIVPLGHRPLELIEDASLIGGRDADPLVRHADDGLGLLAADGHVDGQSAAVLHGVRQEVGDHLIDAKRVPGAEEV